MMPTHFAAFPKRLAAFIVDSLICAAVVGMIFWPLIVYYPDRFIVKGVSLHGVAFSELTSVMLREFMPGIHAFLLGFLLSGLIQLVYFSLFESGPRQATPGKMLLGLFVTDLQGRRISFSRALGRTLGKVVSKMFCYLGFLMALFTERNQALHDLMAGTLVLEPAFPSPPASPPAPPADIPGSGNPTPTA